MAAFHPMTERAKRDMRGLRAHTELPVLAR